MQNTHSIHQFQSTSINVCATTPSSRLQCTSLTSSPTIESNMFSKKSDAMNFIPTSIRYYTFKSA